MLGRLVPLGLSYCNQNSSLIMIAGFVTWVISRASNCNVAAVASYRNSSTQNAFDFGEGSKRLWFLYHRCFLFG